MISQAQVDEVRRYLAEGNHSQRMIAKLTGLSRGTIGAIASGKRHDRAVDALAAWDTQLGPIVRCPGCGGRVYAPCRLCFVRALKSPGQDGRRRNPDRAESSNLRTVTMGRRSRLPNDSSRW